VERGSLGSGLEAESEEEDGESGGPRKRGVEWVGSGTRSKHVFRCRVGSG
jgi:hypothetical protein